jgi:hypothetical protein
MSTAVDRMTRSASQPLPAVSSARRHTTQHREWLQRLHRYAAFTDIEFNPQRSVNGQARSTALFVSLLTKGRVDSAVDSPQAFIATATFHHRF